MLVTPALERLRQEDQEFKANLVYVAGFKDILDYIRPLFKKQKKIKVEVMCPFQRLFLILDCLHVKQTLTPKQAPSR